MVSCSRRGLPPRLTSRESRSTFQATLEAVERGECGPIFPVRLLAYDLFQPFPDRAGLILMKRVICDWEGLEAVRILSHARAALEPRGGSWCWMQ